MKRMDEKRSARFFFSLFGLYTIVTYGLSMMEFFTKGDMAVPSAVSGIYLVALTLYVGDKEVRRLRKKYVSIPHEGEYFVYLWGISFIAVTLYVVAGGRDEGFGVPADLATNAGVVLLLSFVTDVLKAQERKRV